MVNITDAHEEKKIDMRIGTISVNSAARCSVAGDQLVKYANAMRFLPVRLE